VSWPTTIKPAGLAPSAGRFFELIALWETKLSWLVSASAEPMASRKMQRSSQELCCSVFDGPPRGYGDQF
jgi:hypothetical protein